MTEKESPFACDMTAIAPEQRGAHLATIEKLVSTESEESCSVSDGERSVIAERITFSFSESWSSTILFDGVRVHPLLNYTHGRHQFGVMFERGRNPGASYSISF